MTDTPGGPNDVEPEGRAVVFTLRARPGRERELREWAPNIVRAARAVDGNLDATVIGLNEASELRFLYHFRDEASLQTWLTSPERAQLLADAESLVADGPSLERTGLETWFESPTHVHAAMVPPPRWKMWLVSLVAIYPLVLAFQLWITPHLVDWHWPLAVRAAALPLVVLSLMTFFVMPNVMRVVGPWLAKRPRG